MDDKRSLGDPGTPEFGTAGSRSPKVSSTPFSLDSSPLSDPNLPQSLITEQLQQRVFQLEKELYRRRLSSNLHLEGTEVDSLGRSCSDLLQGKDVEVMRLQVELASLKVIRERREADFARERNALREENTRVKAQLETALEKENQLTRELKEAVDTAKVLTGAVEVLQQEKQSLQKQVELLEAEVYSEKQYSSSVQRSTSDTIKQLLDSKTVCEGELDTLREQYNAFVQKSTQIEGNLREKIQEMMTECEFLREKVPIPTENSELMGILEVKNREIAEMQENLVRLEDKVLNISAQLAQERATRFEEQNLLSQDNETLRTENDLLKHQKASETRNYDDLLHQIQVYEMRLQDEREVRNKAVELQEVLSRRDMELHRCQVELEAQEVQIRRLEEKVMGLQEQLTDKHETQKSAEAQFICELTKEKLEAEKLFYAEVESRAKVEEKLYSRELALLRAESELSAIRENTKSPRKSLKYRSFQSDTHELQSPSKILRFKGNTHLQTPEETKEPVGNTGLPGEVPDRNKRELNEMCTNLPCNCLLW